MIAISDSAAQLMGSLAMGAFLVWALQRGQKEREEAETDPRGVRRRRLVRLGVLLIVVGGLVLALLLYDPRAK